MSSEVYPGTCPPLVTSVGPALVSITVSHPRPRTALEGGFTPYCSVGVEDHVADPVSLRQGDLPVGDDRHGNAGELVLSEVGFQGLRDAVGQVGRRGRVGHTKLAGGHEEARIEHLGLRPRPPSCALSGPIGRPGRGRSGAGLGRRA